MAYLLIVCICWFVVGVMIGIALYRKGFLNELDMISHRYNSFQAVLIGFLYDNFILFIIICGILGPLSFFADRVKK